MSRIALGLAYDGALWRGWQTQPGGQTVQDELQKALFSFTTDSIETVCAGRTDAGVHAVGQVVHLDTQVDRKLESWVRGLNTLLPESIAVQWAHPVADDFHARFSATARTYIYVLRNSRVRSPLTRSRAGWVYQPLDLAAMQCAAARLLGEHDFSSFRSSQCQAASPVRTLYVADIQQHGEFFVFTFKANAFLHHMVRNLMGTLLYVGLGRQQPEWVDTLLHERDRRLAAPTFAANGLYFARVEYPEHFGLPIADAQTSFIDHLGLAGSGLHPL